MSGVEHEPQHRRGVVDTSTVILLAGIDPLQLPEEPVITTVTLAELSVGPLVATNDRERTRRQAHVQAAEASFVPLPFDVPAARAFAGVAASLHSAGRKTAARAYDAMIAAVAIANGLRSTPATRWTSPGSTTSSWFRSSTPTGAVHPPCTNWSIPSSMACAK